MKILKVELTEEECMEIMTQAIESNAIAYWCEELEFSRNIETLIVSKINVLVCDDELPVVNKHHVDSGVVRLGVNRLLSGEVDVRSDIVASIVNEDIDSECADCIIQVGLFGEIIYG